MTSEEYKSFARKMVEDEYYAPIENRDRKMAELDAQIAELDAKIAERHECLINCAKFMKLKGVSIDKIAQATKLPKETISQL